MTLRARGLSVLLVFAPIAHATGPSSLGGSVQPFIDEVREDSEDARPRLPERSFTESILGDLEPAPSSTFLQEVREDNPDFFSKPPEDSFTETKKKEEPPRGSAIAAVHEGRSELLLKRPGSIRGAGGFTIGATRSRDITASNELGERKFSEVYGDGWAPNLTLFFEFQPFHSEWFGNFGIVTLLGLEYFHGNGKFKNSNLRRPGGSSFDVRSNTRFQFFKMPLTLGLNYRFNLLRILRPYVFAGPSLIGYAESRADRGLSGASKGTSRGLTTSLGTSVLLDWISRESTWNYYQDYGVKHFYLTLEYSRLTTLSGAVDFTESGLSAGLTFEL